MRYLWGWGMFSNRACESIPGWALHALGRWQQKHAVNWAKARPNSTRLSRVLVNKCGWKIPVISTRMATVLPRLPLPIPLDGGRSRRCKCRNPLGCGKQIAVQCQRNAPAVVDTLPQLRPLFCEHKAANAFFTLYPRRGESARLVPPPANPDIAGQPAVFDAQGGRCHMPGFRLLPRSGYAVALACYAFNADISLEEQRAADAFRKGLEPLVNEATSPYMSRWSGSALVIAAWVGWRCRKLRSNSSA